jgi:hypothetical protein
MRRCRDEAMIVRAVSFLACAAAAVCMPLPAPGENRADAGAIAVALEYSAVPGCPDVSDFKSIVVGRLGYDAFRENAPDRVLVDIASRGSAFEGRIEWRNAEGRWAGDRTFPSRSDDCGEIGRAMAFALALQIQFSARARVFSSPSRTVAPTEAGNTSGTAPSPIPASIANTPMSNARETGPTVTKATTSPILAPRPTLAIGAGASLGFGLSSGAVPFARAFGSMAWPHSSLELAVEVAWPTTTRREDGAGFSQQQLLVGVAGCGDFQPASACLLAKAGAIRIVGKDIDNPRSPWAPILETGLRLAVQQSFGRHFYLAARAEGMVNVTRWRVSLDQNLVWTSPRFAATIGLDLGVRFHQDTSPEVAIAQVAGGRDE